MAKSCEGGGCTERKAERDIGPKESERRILGGRRRGKVRMKDKKDLVSRPEKGGGK